MAPPNDGIGCQTSISVHSGTRTASTETETSLATTRDNLLYISNSYDCFRSPEYQCNCIRDLFHRIFSENSPPNGDELTRLLLALSLQAPNFQPPLPPDFIPIIRFDSGKVPYFEFHFFTKSLPLMTSLSGSDVFLKTVNDDILNYSAAIFQCMMDFGNMQNNSQHTPMQRSFRGFDYTQETAYSSGKAFINLYLL